MMLYIYSGFQTGRRALHITRAGRVYARVLMLIPQSLYKNGAV